MHGIVCERGWKLSKEKEEKCLQTSEIRVPDDT